MAHPEQEAVLAECELLLRRALDLIDSHRMNRVIAARLAHLLHDLSTERTNLSRMQAFEEIHAPH